MVELGIPLVPTSMKLEIEVTDCNDCPCATGDVRVGYVCDHPEVNRDDTTIKHTNRRWCVDLDMPNWCPLKKKEEQNGKQN